VTPDLVHAAYLGPATGEKKSPTPLLAWKSVHKKNQRRRGWGLYISREGLTLNVPMRRKGNSSKKMAPGLSQVPSGAWQKKSMEHHITWRGGEIGKANKGK